ncbi:MAG TPA: helix-turn-helix domain-containing protein [Smithellaceae bacterium]|nr:helix-turn-helix domain-containing protein [Smithellaceae bacterium]
MTHASFPDIGHKIAGRDHSTVIYATNKISQKIETDQKLKLLVKDIEDNLINKT